MRLTPSFSAWIPSWFTSWRGDCSLRWLCLGIARDSSASAAGNLAIVITAIFATNWHVLETSLLIMSEPAFMLVLFPWLMLTLRWDDWYQHAGKAAVVGLLAVAAWSVRGAGIVCVATTVFYPFYVWLRQRRAREETAATLKILPVTILFLLPVIYQLILMLSSPEKSITAGRESANSYPKQFLNGLLGENVIFMILSHLDDYAASFVPWFRENPDYHFRDAIGKIFGILGLLGWLAHLLGAMNMRGMRRDDALKAERKPLWTRWAKSSAENFHSWLRGLVSFMAVQLSTILVPHSAGDAGLCDGCGHAIWFRWQENSATSSGGSVACVVDGSFRRGSGGAAWELCAAAEFCFGFDS